MTPEIKTAKLNTADFGKAKITEKAVSVKELYDFNPDAPKKKSK